MQLIICNRGLQNQTLTYGNIMSRLHNLKLFNNPIRNTLSRSSHLIQGVHCPSVSSSPVAPGPGPESPVVTNDLMDTRLDSGPRQTRLDTPQPALSPLRTELDNMY